MKRFDCIKELKKPTHIHIQKVFMAKIKTNVKNGN